MRLAVDTNEHFVQVPTPIRIRMMLNPALPDLRGEDQAEPVPPQPHHLMTDVDTAFVQQILDLAQRQRIADVHHHRQADHPRETIEIAEWISHPTTLRTKPAPPKSLWSDTALQRP